MINLYLKKYLPNSIHEDENLDCFIPFVFKSQQETIDFINIVIKSLQEDISDFEFCFEFEKELI